MGRPTGYAELRRLYFGETGGPGAAPADPTTLQAVIDEFTARIAPHTLNSYHPRALSYFTPPPLVASIAGEVLAQWTNQGIDVWHAGPGGAFVEEEVVRWLCDLVGYGGGSFGLCTSGGVMANFIAMTLVRDVHLRAIRGGSRPPRGAGLEGVRVYTGDQTHFSIARALDELGFPPETLVVLPADDRYRLHAEPVAAAIEADRARGLTPVAICAVAGSTNTGSVDLVPDLGGLAAREGLWFHVDAAYGGRRAPVCSGRAPGPRPRARRQRHRGPPQVVLPGLRPRCARGAGRRPPPPDLRPLARVLPRRRGPAGAGRTAARRRGRCGHDAHAGQLNFYKLGMEGTRRFRALKLWASWKHLGTSGLGRLVERTTTSPRTSRRAAREADDLEAVPAEPELSVVCFRHLPGGAAAGRGDGPGARSMPTRTGSPRRSRSPATAGSRPRPWAAPPTCAPAS